MGYCDWANANALLKEYHDEEWGVPVFDDVKMFEHLSLECLQCGLSWNLMLKKRAVYRSCFAGFDYRKIALFTESDVERILQTDGMLKAPRKIRAILNNARKYLEICEQYGSFCAYLWSFTEDKTVLYDGHEKANARIPVSNGLSARIGADLKKRGFAYIGAITVYSHLQACGIINDHDETCPCYARINARAKTVRLPLDGEVYGGSKENPARDR